MSGTPVADPRLGLAGRDFTVANLSCPREVMQFHLVYHGPLPASGNKRKAKEARTIRDKFHLQLEYLWQTRAALKRLRRTARVRGPEVGDLWGSNHSESPFDSEIGPNEPLPPGWVDLCEPVTQNKNIHIPLVRSSLDLNCSLDILFLRQEDPGSLLLQGGDVDGRIKTLLDALSTPKPEVEMKYKQKQKTTYSLLENDSLVSGINVSTDRLLFPETEYPNEVHLVIEVTVRVLKLGAWNVCLLGD